MFLLKLLGIAFLVLVVLMGALIAFAAMMGGRIKRRLEKEGVDCWCDLDTYGFDPNRRRADGKMCCMLHMRWVHPTTGEARILDSPWFWADPDVSDRPELKRLPVRIILTDPAIYHLKLEGVEFWTH